MTAGWVRSPLAPDCGLTHPADLGVLPQTLFWVPSESPWVPVLPCVPSAGRAGGTARMPPSGPLARWQPPLQGSWGCAGPPSPPCRTALPGGLLHGHVPVRRAGHPPRPRRHPARSRRWDLVLHHTQVGEDHGRHGGPRFPSRRVCGGGPGSGAAGRRGPAPAGHLPVPSPRPLSRAAAGGLSGAAAAGCAVPGIVVLHPGWQRRPA